MRKNAQDTKLGMKERCTPLATIPIGMVAVHYRSKAPVALPGNKSKTFFLIKG